MTLLAPVTAIGPGPPKPAQGDVGIPHLALPQVEPAKNCRARRIPEECSTVIDVSSRTERLRQVHGRRLLWQPIPRCGSCGRVLSVLSTAETAAACERCLVVDGVLSVDSPASVTAAFQNAARCIGQVVEETRGEASIWDSRLQNHNVSARLMSGSPRGQRGWSVLRLTPSCGAKVEQYACVEPAVRQGCGLC